MNSKIRMIIDGAFSGMILICLIEMIKGIIVSEPTLKWVVYFWTILFIKVCIDRYYDGKGQ